MTTLHEEDDDDDKMMDKSSSQIRRDDLSSGGSEGTPLESSSQGTSSGNSSGRHSFDLFGFTKYSIAAISCTRWIFLSTLLLAAAGLTTGIFLTLDKAQQEDFTVQVSYAHLGTLELGMNSQRLNIISHSSFSV
jgi:hypothetical protein